jgi:hypothetical protein
MKLTITCKEKAWVGIVFMQDGYQNGPDWDWYYEAVQRHGHCCRKIKKEYLEIR